MERGHPITDAGMNVTVTRMGGIAGIPATWEVHVEDQPDAEAWHQLLQRLPWEQLPSIRSSQPFEPDRFSYRISCPPHAVVLSEPQVDGPWRELIDRIRADGSTQHRTDAASIASEGGSR